MAVSRGLRRSGTPRGPYRRRVDQRPAEVTSGTTGVDTVRAELRRLVRPPFDDLAVVVLNAALVCGGWFLLPPSVQDWLFARTGPMAFAVVLESWMLADTPATNMLANDPQPALAALDDRHALLGLLRAKAVALALVVAPACAVVAAAIGVHEGTPAAGLFEAALVLVLPFGTLALAPLLGIRWPYHPRPLTWRRRHLRPYRRTVRWLLLLVVPYGYVPSLLAALVVPPVLVVAAWTGQSDRLTTAEIAVASSVAAMVSLVVFVLGSRLAVHYTARRRATLGSYLADPDRG